MAIAYAPPRWLLKECASVIIPTITNTVNLSLSSGHLHPLFKQSVVSPLLKKSTLDNEQLSNYRLISNLSLISKIIERVVKSRRDHLFSRSLLNHHQSAYRRHHSTETSLLYCTSTTTSSLLLVHKNFLVSVYLISLLPLTP